MSNVSTIILTLSCKDQPGIVAAVANLFALQGFTIRESSQFEDVHSRRFFMRTVLESCEGSKSMTALKTHFQPLAKRYAMDWGLYDKDAKPKVLIAVSQSGHCLSYLLNNWKRKALAIDIAGVVSNHKTQEALCQWYNIPFHYLPIDPASKPAQEQQLQALMHTQQIDLLVLARYMQILSDGLCAQLKGRAINIHHSFLPSFKGAKPYHQAYDRGVKLIGATAHYVTTDLDEGPIIEQSVERVSHANTPEELVEIGRDTEAIVLNRAVRWHSEHRILLNGDKTVVFDR
ncbi:MAG: formyltetrahydrofolate deformylase [Cellvibrionaceae bacterium]|nr:formyltetrahydrofolate deformylase [Cellvibrionaceae bacterium]